MKDKNQGQLKFKVTSKKELKKSEYKYMEFTGDTGTYCWTQCYPAIFKGSTRNGKLTKGTTYTITEIWKITVYGTKNATNAPAAVPVTYKNVEIYFVKGKGWIGAKQWVQGKSLWKLSSKSEVGTIADKVKAAGDAGHIKDFNGKKTNKSNIEGQPLSQPWVTAALAALGGLTGEAAADADVDVIEKFKSRYMITYDNKVKAASRFNRYQYQNQFNVINGAREYIFFTKPKLNIMKNSKSLNKALKNDPYWIDMKRYYRRIIAYLQGDDKGGMQKHSLNTDYRHQFIPLLTNMVASNLDMPSKSAETTDTPQTIYGTSIQYRKSSYKSDEGYDFSLEFYDDKWLDVYHLFKMWDEFENLKDIGILGPPSKDFTVKKRLCDQISIYKFIVDADDMSTIIFYAKFTGCFPKSVPREAFSELKEGIISYSIDWHAQFVEEMNPVILSEFNSLCKKYMNAKDNTGLSAPTADSWNAYAANYNKNKGYMRYADSGFVACPYIIRVSEPFGHNPTGNLYKLIWLDNDTTRADAGTLDK